MTIALILAATLATSVFEGRTPCGPVAVEFTGYPAQNCEKIKWRLTLHGDSKFVYQGTRTRREGTWSIVRGRPGDATAVVYRLRYDDRGPKSVAFLRVDDVLLLLDCDLKAVTGDAGYSYTINRVR